MFYKIKWMKCSIRARAVLSYKMKAQLPWRPLCKTQCCTLWFSLTDVFANAHARAYSWRKQLTSFNHRRRRDSHWWRCAPAAPRGSHMTWRWCSVDARVWRYRRCWRTSCRAGRARWASSRCSRLTSPAGAAVANCATSRLKASAWRHDFDDATTLCNELHTKPATRTRSEVQCKSLENLCMRNNLHTMTGDHLQLKYVLMQSAETFLRAKQLYMMTS